MSSCRGLLRADADRHYSLCKIRVWLIDATVRAGTVRACLDTHDDGRTLSICLPITHQLRAISRGPVSSKRWLATTYPLVLYSSFSLPKLTQRIFMPQLKIPGTTARYPSCRPSCQHRPAARPSTTPGFQWSRIFGDNQVRTMSQPSGMLLI